ncbi:uncharacterized protein LOC134189953 [Corticium candelabrum]|uniref:uncharacterized protein LOC134189953 n=1 Tax=Corticium candelabrum TaxID=121492 RepID=UPI002E25B13B|nr:uncharacterized protein LOC134189953 [Corticium candelabrum]
MQGVVEYVGSLWRRWTGGDDEKPTPVVWASEQPNWDGLKDALDVDPHEFMQQILSEATAESLAKRGYAIVKLSPEVIKACQDMHIAMATFMKQSADEKAKFATKTDDLLYSPNQYHGYSKMKGLKEQFMVRACGHGMPLLFPGSYPTGVETDSVRSPHFGCASLKLYSLLDLLCRSVLEQVCDANHIPRKKGEDILDPLSSNHDRLETTVADDSKCWTSYVLPGYISSSLLDMFHYYNKFDREDGSNEKYKNNHLSHTDSGILTLVPCAAIPGLEGNESIRFVAIQSISEWISLEKIIHDATSTEGAEMFSREGFATVFWGDSCVYLTGENAQPCLHRVARSDLERYSYVFKMRTQPEATAPRYQEDFDLAVLQRKAVSDYSSNS